MWHLGERTEELKVAVSRNEKYNHTSPINKNWSQVSPKRHHRACEAGTSKTKNKQTNHKAEQQQGKW